jgi:hypothetical protein
MNFLLIQNDFKIKFKVKNKKQALKIIELFPEYKIGAETFLRSLYLTNNQKRLYFKYHSEKVTLRGFFYF